MKTNIKNIYEIIEEIKQNITDNQYKIIMDNLMVLNKKQEEKKESDEDTIDELHRQIIIFK